MPYTPPKNSSPSSTVSSSPSTSRRSSFDAAQRRPSQSSEQTARPGLPRSSAYLTRHARKPSDVSAVTLRQPVAKAPSSAENLSGMVPVQHERDDEDGLYGGRSLRQSPPPVTSDRQIIPTGAVLSPPESPSSSSDDDEDSAAGAKLRGRRIGDIHELKQLHEAISQLPQQRRESSPTGPSDDHTKGVPVLSRPTMIPYSFSTSALDELATRDQLARRSALIHGRSSSSSSGGRRVSHVRSATEPTVTPPDACSIIGSDEETDGPRKPQMVRKKSGELVRPALRLGSRRRPSSMPGTPTFSKAVHFDSHLEHVRHFLQVDRPTAVSAGSSPVDTMYDSESEYPFGAYGSNVHKQPAPPLEWELSLTSFPVDTAARKEQPVRLERVWLSADQKSLNGSVAVSNLAFSKAVVCRFTFDYWKTTSEVAASYSAEILPRVSPVGHDRFNFNIKLYDVADLESKTLFFCIRYNVNGQEFWDNNDSHNFQIDFKKKIAPMHGKAGQPKSGGLPRSNGRRPNPSTAPRPLSLPPALDDFGNGEGMSIQDFLGEAFPPLRLKSSASTSSIPSDNLSSRLMAPSGLAFANRYDFGASLSAARQATKYNKDSFDANGTVASGPGLYMKSGRKATPPPTTSPSSSSSAPSSTASSAPTNAPKQALKESIKAATPRSSLSSGASNAVLASSASLYGSGSISSKSYEEILSKYCFYVPNQSGHMRDTTVHIRQADGTVSELVTQNPDSPPSSSEGSPVMLGSGFHRHASTAAKHSMPGTGLTADGFLIPRADDMPLSPTATPLPSTLTRRDQREAGSTASGTSTHAGGGSRSASPKAAAATSASASPGSMRGAYSSFSGSSSSDFAYQHLQDRFPFNSDAQSATIIRG